MPVHIGTGSAGRLEPGWSSAGWGEPPKEGGQRQGPELGPGSTETLEAGGQNPSQGNRRGGV